VLPSVTVAILAQGTHPAHATCRPYFLFLQVRGSEAVRDGEGMHSKRGQYHKVVSKLDSDTGNSFPFKLRNFQEEFQLQQNNELV